MWIIVLLMQINEGKTIDFLFLVMFCLPDPLHAAAKKKKGMSDKLLPLVKFKPQRNSHFALIMTDDIFETSDPVLVFKHFSLN